MWIFALLPFVLQAVAIGIDEGYFHYRRGLPKWERIGHPLDTLSLLSCFLIVIWLPYSSDNLNIFIFFSVISCLMVTKDEFVHKHHCKGAENWLHALLFILHPVTLAMACLLWPLSQGQPGLLANIFNDANLIASFLQIQTFCVFLFFAYQIIFWNFIWKDRPVLKH